MSAEHCATLSIGLLFNPRAFLATNIVRADMGPDKAIPTARLRWFDVERSAAPVLTADGRATGGKIYSATEAPATGRLLVYYLPWNPNTGYYIDLAPEDGASRLMLTGLLTGCAVGYRPLPDGAAHVSHHNLAHARGRRDEAQRQSLEGYYAIHRSEYDVALGPDDADPLLQGMASVIGVKHDGVWDFWAQVFMQCKYSWRINNVRRLADPPA